MSSPQNTPEFDRTDEQPKSAYLSKKDFKVFVFAILLLVILLLPVYFMLKKRAEAFICKKNFQGISAAMNLYAEQFDDKLPPTYAISDGQAPYLEHGAVVSWASLIEPFMPSEATFKCPTADDSEDTPSSSSRQDPAAKSTQDGPRAVKLSYGMYAPYACMARSLIPSPEAVVLVAETSNMGAAGTFDPNPLLDAKGAPSPYDAFVIHWDNSNELPDKKTQFVTRLGFPNSSGGKFEKDGATRHPDGNIFLTVSGRTRVLNPRAAHVEQARGGLLKGLWAVPDSFVDAPKR